MTAQREDNSIRSYVLRQGRFTAAQRRAWQQHAEQYLVPPGFSPAADGGWAALFGRHAPLVVEIGSGYGEATAQMAAADGGRDYLAIEVHAPGVGALMNRLADSGISNVRIAHEDALRALPSLLTDGSVAAVNIFFPDPWRKRRHHKRRLLRPAVLTLLLQKMAPGAALHFVTDWESYAEQAREAFAATPTLIAATPPPRPPTRYEQHARAAARKVHEFYLVHRP